MVQDQAGSESEISTALSHENAIGICELLWTSFAKYLS